MNFNERSEQALTTLHHSEGMLMEVGAATALGKKIILAQQQSSVGKIHLDTVADETFVWRDEGD